MILCVLFWHVYCLVISSKNRGAAVKVLGQPKKNEIKKIVSVKVSELTLQKAVQLERFIKYSSAQGIWGRDEKLLHCNLLLVPTSRNYTVLLALGRSNNKKL